MTDREAIEYAENELESTRKVESDYRKNPNDYLLEPKTQHLNKISPAERRGDFFNKNQRTLHRA